MAKRTYAYSGKAYDGAIYAPFAGTYETSNPKESSSQVWATLVEDLEERYPRRDIIIEVFNKV